jgi:hypothetical protein
MKRAALCLLVLLVLLPTAAFADSLDSVSPSSVFLGDEGDFLTLQGTGLFGGVNTQIVINGPAGTFTLDPSASSVDNGTNPPTDFLVVAVPGEVMVTAGHYSVTVMADDGGGTVRSIGPQFFDVVAHSVQQNPLISVPENVFAEATSASGANVTFFVGGFSFVDPPPAPTVVCDHNSGDLYPIGETIVHCTATDSFGSASGSFPLFVLDTTGPVVTVPADIFTNNPVVTYTASANDAVNGSVAVHCIPTSGSTFDFGTTQVVCLAYDAQANIGTATFNVTVSNGPVLTLPADITAEATSSAGAAVSFTVTATDNATIVCTPASGSIFALGTTAVNCTANAVTGSTSGSFNVTVRDTTPPALTLPANITKEATSASGATATFTVSAIDIVDGVVPASCDHASGATFALGTTTVQCTATDAHHNVGTGSFLVIVRDTTPPVLTLPANITAEATSSSGAVVTFTATSTDIVDGARPVTCTPASGSTFPLGTTTVQCTATDTHNNTANGSFTVLVRDTTPPVIVKITASPETVWPPNDKMVLVTITVIATDAVDNNPVSQIISVRTTEGGDDEGDPNEQGGDDKKWKITGPLTVKLRAENDDHRVYKITIETADFSGNKTQGVIKVPVKNPRGHASH